MKTKLILPTTLHRLEKIDSSEPDTNAGYEIDLAVAYLLIQINRTRITPGAWLTLDKALRVAVPASWEFDTQADMQSFVSEHWSDINLEDLLSRLDDSGVGLMLEGESRSGLIRARSWTTTFTSDILSGRDPLKHVVESKGRPVSVSDSGFRLLQEFKAGSDESIDVQAFAGSGKTHWARLAIEHLNPDRTLLLANREAQLEGMVSRLDANACRQMSFGELAWRMYRRYYGRGHDPLHGRHSPKTNCSNSIIAKTLGFGPTESFNPEWVASIARRAVNSYAASAQPDITEKNLPSLYGNISAADRLYLVQCAQNLWNEMFVVQYPDLRLPVRGFHLLKFLSLTEHQIPSEYSHVVIDEAHEIFPSARQILNRSPQAVLSLGDRYQRFSGADMGAARNIRSRYMTLSHRAGKSVERIVNPILEKHIDKPTSFLEGNSNLETTVRFYDKPFVPSGTATVLVDSELVLFEWFQRLMDEGGSFALLNGSKGSFKLYITSLLDFYHRGIRPTHPMLFKYSNWETLSQKLGTNRSFTKVLGLLERGYDVDDFEAKLKKVAEITEPRILLGKVEDAKNLEFETVMLAPDVADPLKLNLAPSEKAEVLNRIYTGVTRGKRRIILPDAIELIV